MPRSLSPLMLAIALTSGPAAPALADPDDSFAGGSAADFGVFVTAAPAQFTSQEELQAFERGVMSLVMTRYPPAASAGPLEHMMMLEAAFEAAGDTMAGLSYREIEEYGRVVASRSQDGSATAAAELSEEELQACLRERVQVAFLELRQRESPFLTDSVIYSVESRLDRSIAHLDMDLIYWTEGRSVPWATANAYDVISGGVEPGERYDLEQDVNVYGWQEKPEPLVWELRLNDVSDADGQSFLRDFGQEACAAG